MQLLFKNKNKKIKIKKLYKNQKTNVMSFNLRITFLSVVEVCCISEDLSFTYTRAILYSFQSDLTSSQNNTS